MQQLKAIEIVGLRTMQPKKIPKSRGLVKTTQLIKLVSYIAEIIHVKYKNL